ncbi:endosomal peripheral membrane protein (Mon2), putative [Trichophyton benhamiae CBS 112371]|uniref:Endosomal peripheral membrane protein (Mon2), putative n=1 Tax=Arthroderma benhamiae (strain ATCC MYA-4681 / CBS 112371) TaxID=663331 RepID=D4AW57_ARTBC|nr:endosomal peripheral membrane protein (Mon2), putative [Trichophyton benhamiae CBS 112371]EFE32597.1 endosomal peripheral membrane protein (Mon2), putative [Trichophyton benhamiae CBS 112371]
MPNSANPPCCYRGNESSKAGLEIQLKILQTLPSLFRFYADNLTGALLASTLEICATLQNSKTTAVSNTAAATLQQLVIAIFEKVSQEDSKNGSDVSYTTISVEGQKLEVSTFSYDAFRILEDLCRLLEGEQLTYLNIKSLSKIFILELIESILVNNTSIFANHPEHTQVLRHRLLPLAVRYLSERQSFSLTVRVARIALYILKAHLSLLTVECEVILSLLIHLIDTETSLPWKRVLCMEIFRSLYTEPGIIRLMYTLFDKEEGRKAVLKDHMSCLVRLSSEKSSLIGLGHQSTIPLAPQTGKDTMEDQVTLESVGVSGIIGSPSNKSEMCGISTQWSLLRVPYIETLDKVDSPSPPDTYIYSLVLNCIAAFSESMAKFIIPLAVAESKSKRKRNTSSSDKERNSNQQDAGRKEPTGRSSIPPNPLELNSHPQISDIQATAGIIEVCWPAILATSSTFLYAALDGEFYHSLVRAFQKLAHVAGLLRLATPRDAFLTTLGKAAVPTDLPGPNPDGSTLNSPVIDNTNQRPSVSEATNSPVDSPIHMLNTRNLLCLRALLNLGIALGPTLDRDAWSIILETLQNAELVINATSSTFVSMPTDPALEAKNLNSDTPKSNLGPEIMAVQAVTNKLCESTGDYTNSAFKTFLMTLLSLPESFMKDSETPSSQKQSSPLLTQGQNGGRIHQNKRSLSVALGRNRVREDELKFVLEKTHAVAKANIERLSLSKDEGIWELLVKNLLKTIQNDQISSALRLKASDVTNTVISNTIKLTESTEEESRNSVQLRGLHALKSQSSIPFHGRRSSSSSRAVDLEVHEFALETLKSILEGSGQSVVAGWNLVFELISSVFDNEIQSLTETDENQRPIQPTPNNPKLAKIKSQKLLRTAFDSLQLIASDFLSLLPASCLLELVECFYSFASQKEDFNISLTATTSFWNISDFLRVQIDRFSCEDEITVSTSEAQIVEIAQSPYNSSSTSALWLLLLLRMVDLTVDTRTEVRNSAIQTMLRILDNSSEQLSPAIWHLCLNKILFVMAEAVQAKTAKSMGSSPENPEELKPWVDTSVLLSKGLSNLIATYFTTIIRSEDFHKSWTRLLLFYEPLIKLDSLDLKEAIFSSLSQILSCIQTPEDIGINLVQQAWDVWANGNIVSKDVKPDYEHSNQSGLLAYFKAYRQLYRLLNNHLGEQQILDALQNTQLAVEQSIHSKYSPDIETPSELQTQILECFRTLCADKPNSQSAIMDSLSTFFQLPMVNWTPQADRAKPTFVALSKSSMKLLSWYIGENGLKPNVLPDGVLSNTLERLTSPIFGKYKWLGKDGSPPLWQTATTASLDLIEIAVGYVEAQYSTCDRTITERFWASVVEVVKAVVSCGEYTNLNLTPSTLLSDEQFDIAAFERLRGMIIPALGSSFVSPKIRRDFAFVLFNSSHVYPPQRLDLPDNSAQKEPLRDLYKVRRGRTHGPQPTMRSKLSYVLVDTLFDLASVRKRAAGESQASSPNFVTPYIYLAKSVSPYLILRCALPLKSYIADQPLLGLMPQPIISRKELMYLLTRLVDLKSEPTAIPAAGPSVPIGGPNDSPDDDEEDEEESGSSTTARFKKHLGWMYPLVIRAITVAGKESKDRQVLDALTKVLEGIQG